MARKKVFIDIQLTGQNTIAGLEQDLKAINAELKNVEFGTQEFVQLEAQALKVRSQLKSVRNDLKPITGTEQIAALKTLGSGLAGAFQVGGAAAAIFGKQTEEQFNKIAKSVGVVMVAMDGFNKLLTLSTRGNILRLKSLAVQWGLVGNSAKIAGISMRTALISTGIGALLVAVGLLIANWKKLGDLINTRSAARESEKESERLDKELEVLKEQFSILEQQAQAQKTLNDLRGESEKNLKVEEDLLENKRLLLLKEIEKISNDITNNETEADKQLEKRNRRILKRKRDAAEAVFDELIQTNELEQQRIDTLNDELQLLDKKIELTSGAKDINLDSQKDLIAALEREQTILEANNNSFEKKYNNQKAILKAKQDEIRLEAQLAGFVSKEQQRQLLDIEAQIEALRLREDIRKEELKTNLMLIKLEIERNRTYDKFNLQLLRAEKSIKRFQLIEKDRQDLLSNNQKLIEIDIRGLENARQIQDDLINFDRRRNDILERRTNELIPSEVRITKEAFREIENFLKTYSEQFDYLDIEYFGKALKEGIVEELEDGTIKQVFTGIVNFRSMLLQGMADETGVLKEFKELNKYEQQAINRAAENLSLREIEADFYIKSLTAQSQAIDEQLNLQSDIIISYEGIVQQIKNEASELDSIHKIQLDIADAELMRIENGEERTISDADLFEIQKYIFELETQRFGISQELNNSVAELEQKYENCNELQKQVLDVEFELLQAKTAVNILQEDSVNNLIEQLRLSAQLNATIQKYGEEIYATQDLLFTSLGAVSAVFDRIAAQRSEDLQTWKEENKDALQEIADTEKRLGDRRRELNDLLVDAEGDRYDMIMDELNNIANQEAINAEADKQYKNKEMEMQYEIDKAEFNAAKWRKAQGMVDIAIATALAVVKALPNVVLSALVGGIGGLQLGIAASQKLPPKPEPPKFMAMGGWLRGDSHSRPSQGIPVMAEDDEFIVNKYAAQQYGNLLEMINSSTKPKMGIGGRPSNINTSNKDIDIIDYDKFAGVLIDALKENPMFISVREFKDVERRIGIVETRTSIGKK